MEYLLQFSAEWESVLQLALTIATIFLAILACWYSWETRKLRKSTEKQLSEQKRQHEENIVVLNTQLRLSAAPIIRPEQITTQKKIFEEDIEKYKNHTDELCNWNSILCDQNNLQVDAVIQLHNPGKLPAYDVTCFLFQAKTFSLSPKTKPFFDSNQTQLYPLISHSYSGKEFARILAKYYGDEVQQTFFQKLDISQTFIATCFSDPEDNVYLQRVFIAREDPLRGLAFFEPRIFLGRRTINYQSEELLHLLFTTPKN